MKRIAKSVALTLFRLVHRLLYTKTHQIFVLNDTIEQLRLRLHDVSNENIRLQKKLEDSISRNNMLEFEAREIAAKGLLAQMNTIYEKPGIVIINTPHSSLMNHSTYANLMNRIQNSCRYLDALVMVKGTLDVEQLSTDDAAQKHNIIAIPRKSEWTLYRAGTLEKIANLFDRFSRE